MERVVLSVGALVLFAGFVVGSFLLGSLSARKIEPPPETAKGCSR